jgi:predicted nucleic acid-binding protein
VTPAQTETALADEPDNRILECAKESASDFILTEDRAMLRLKRFEGIPIMTMLEFLGRTKDL